MKRSLVLLLTIFLIGCFMRFYQLGKVPLSLNWDEVSIGYNSYSILKTGYDEYGKFLPLTFRSFGDYKQPGYIYLAVPSIQSFGLNSYGVRFPSAFFGSLTILIVFFLSLEIFRRHKEKEIISFGTALLFAVSPWSIQFSRFASEANVALFFMLCGAWLFLRSVSKNQRILLFLSPVFFLLSMYTYHSQKLFTPFLIGVLSLYSIKFFLKNKKLFIIFILLFIVGNIPWIIDSSSTERGRSVLFTSEQTQLLKEPIALQAHDAVQNDLYGKIIHNRRIVYVKTYMQNYLSHFDPNFLFIKGDNARHHAPDMGVVYLVSLPFILFGFFRLWRDYKREAGLLTLWFLSAPLVSALAINAPNAIRSMMFLPLWQIFASYGVVSLLHEVKSVRWKKVIVLGIVGLYSVNIFYYAHQYFNHTNTQYAQYWQDGYKQTIEELKKYSGSIVFADDFEQASTFYLFYSQKNPQKYQEEGGSNRVLKRCYQIDTAFFGDCLSTVRKGVYVTTLPIDTSMNAKALKTITYPNRAPAVTIYSFDMK